MSGLMKGGGNDRETEELREAERLRVFYHHVI